MDLVVIGPTVSLARPALLLVVNSLRVDFGLGMYPAVKISVMGAAFVLNEAVKSALSFALVGRYVYIQSGAVEKKIGLASLFGVCVWHMCSWIR